MDAQGPVAAILDWWLLVTCGISPLGVAYHLPDTLPGRVRTPMSQLAQLSHGLDGPAAQWLNAFGSLPQALADAEVALSLDSYGASRLPGERQAWAKLVQSLSESIEALRDGRKATPADFEPEVFSRALEEARVVPNSQRWREMSKRAQACVDAANDAVEVQHLAAPWQHRSAPELLDSIPAEITDLIGTFVDTAFACLLTEAAGASQDPGEAGPDERRLMEELSAQDDESLVDWFCDFATGWIDRHPGRIPAADAGLAKRRAVDEHADKLARAGADVDEVELHLIDHDIASAESVLQDVEVQLREHRRVEALRTFR